MTNPIQQKTLALLERDYARVHPPGAPITQAATVWLAELAETMARQHAQLESAGEDLQHLRPENSQLKQKIETLTEERDSAHSEVQRLRWGAPYAAYPGDDVVDRSIRAHNARHAKRDKLAQRFAAAMLSNGCWGGQPEQLRELAEEYADAFYPDGAL